MTLDQNRKLLPSATQLSGGISGWICADQPMRPQVYVNKGELQNKEIVGNIYLMAAAKEMFDALNEVVDWFDLYENESPAERALLDRVEDALSKARDRQ